MTAAQRWAAAALAAACAPAPAAWAQGGTAHRAVKTPDMALAALYTHGTHVAGIAVAGNPFAAVLPVAMHWSHSNVPIKPGEALSRTYAANFQRAVDAFKAARVGVVNMSWRYGPGHHESALA